MIERFAMIFPGQGSQSVGMMNALAEVYPEIKKTFAQASHYFGSDLWKLVEEGPADRLNETRNTQVVMLAADIAVWRVWCGLGGVAPSVVAGHSLGEYPALVAAEALSFQDAVRVVTRRAELMQEAVRAGVGGLLAIIGLEDDVVRELCLNVAEGQVLSPANFNAIGQVVVAGEQEALNRAKEEASALGAKLVKLLPVSVPAHCALMEPAAAEFAKVLENTPIQSPHIPVIHNVDVQKHSHPDEIREVLQRQLSSPVRWVETIQLMRQEGIVDFVECGPGKVLCGLHKRIDRECKCVSLEKPSDIQSLLVKEES